MESETQNSGTFDATGPSEKDSAGEPASNIETSIESSESNQATTFCSTLGNVDGACSSSLGDVDTHPVNVSQLVVGDTDSYLTESLSGSESSEESRTEGGYEANKTSIDTNDVFEVDDGNKQHAEGGGVDLNCGDLSFTPDGISSQVQPPLVGSHDGQGNGGGDEHPFGRDHSGEGNFLDDESNPTDGHNVGYMESDDSSPASPSHQNDQNNDGSFNGNDLDGQMTEQSQPGGSGIQGGSGDPRAEGGMDCTGGNNYNATAMSISEDGNSQFGNRWSLWEAWKSEYLSHKQTAVSALVQSLKVWQHDPESVSVVFDIINECFSNVLQDHEAVLLRMEILEQMPLLCMHCCDANTPHLKAYMDSTLLPVIIKSLSDEKHQVRKNAQSVLMILVEQNQQSAYITTGDLQTKIMPVLLDLCVERKPSEDSGQGMTRVPDNIDEDIRIETVQLLCKLVHHLGRKRGVQMFLQPFTDLCMDTVFHIRKICASQLGDLSKLLGRELCEQVLVPHLISLSQDKLWGVRKACAENYTEVSNHCSMDTRHRLAPVFISLLGDNSRWVQSAAFQQLGPFISTFAEAEEGAGEAPEDGYYSHEEDSEEGEAVDTANDSSEKSVETSGDPTSGTGSPKVNKTKPSSRNGNKRKVDSNKSSTLDLPADLESFLPPHDRRKLSPVPPSSIDESDYMEIDDLFGGDSTPTGGVEKGSTSHSFGAEEAESEASQDNAGKDVSTTISSMTFVSSTREVSESDDWRKQVGGLSTTLTTTSVTTNGGSDNSMMQHVPTLVSDESNAKQGCQLDGVPSPGDNLEPGAKSTVDTHTPEKSDEELKPELFSTFNFWKNPVPVAANATDVTTLETDEASPATPSPIDPDVKAEQDVMFSTSHTFASVPAFDNSKGVDPLASFMEKRFSYNSSLFKATAAGGGPVVNQLTSMAQLATLTSQFQHPLAEPTLESMTSTNSTSSVMKSMLSSLSGSYSSIISTHSTSTSGDTTGLPVTNVPTIKAEDDELPQFVEFASERTVPTSSSPSPPPPPLPDSEPPEDPIQQQRPTTVMTPKPRPPLTRRDTPAFFSPFITKATSKVSGLAAACKHETISTACSSSATDLSSTSSSSVTSMVVLPTSDAGTRSPPSKQQEQPMDVDGAPSSPVSLPIGSTYSEAVTSTGSRHQSSVTTTISCASITLKASKRSSTLGEEPSKQKDVFGEWSDDDKSSAIEKAMKEMEQSIEDVDDSETFSQDIIPQGLLNEFLSMTEPSRVQVENDISRHCAFNFPAVAYTIGRANWPCLRELYQQLVIDDHWKVRRTLAFSIHELATILGPEITRADLLPAFKSFLKDLDEVRIGVLTHMQEFLKVLEPSSRKELLSNVTDFLTPDNPKNWRFRELLAKQLIEICDLYTVEEVNEFFSPIALTLAIERIAQIRNIACELTAKIIQYFYEEETARLKPQEPSQDVSTKASNALPFTDGVIDDIVKGFARSENFWRRRQTFVFICRRLITSGRVSEAKFSECLLPALLGLHQDRVPNVRVAVASVFSDDSRRSIDGAGGEGYFSGENVKLISGVMDRLRKDASREVQEHVHAYFDEPVPEMKPSQLLPELMNTGMDPGSPIFAAHLLNSIHSMANCDVVSAGKVINIYVGQGGSMVSSLASSNPSATAIGCNSFLPNQSDGSSVSLLPPLSASLSSGYCTSYQQDSDCRNGNNGYFNSGNSGHEQQQNQQVRRAPIATISEDSNFDVFVSRRADEMTAACYPANTPADIKNLEDLIVATSPSGAAEESATTVFFANAPIGSATTMSSMGGPAVLPFDVDFQITKNITACDDGATNSSSEVKDIVASEEESVSKESAGAENVENAALDNAVSETEKLPEKSE